MAGLERLFDAISTLDYWLVNGMSTRSHASQPHCIGQCYVKLGIYIYVFLVFIHECRLGVRVPGDSRSLPKRDETSCNFAHGQPTGRPPAVVLFYVTSYVIRCGDKSSLEAE